MNTKLHIGLAVTVIVMTGCLPKENIFQAAKAGNVDRVRSLIESEPALLTVRDQDGMTALSWAASRGHVNVAEYLVSKGADVNTTSTVGRTPLHYAARNGHLEMVKFLLSKGADTEIKSYEQRTPFDAAVKGMNDEIAEIIQNHAESKKAR